MDRANRLKQEADSLLDLLQIPEIFAPYGGVTYNGSYFLDVMAYPDIDLYVPQMTIPEIFQAGAKLAAFPYVKEIVFSKSSEPTLPGGLYLKPRIDTGDWGRPWKIDIWSIDLSLMKSKMAVMDHFKAHMTPALREFIIAYKVSILNEQGRTPMYSGYYIYKAVFDESLRNPAEITDYLRLNGITI
jgi:hypothetical protein